MENTQAAASIDADQLCIPKHFQFGGIASGIKKSGKTDLSAIVCQTPCTALGVVTQNLIRASCIDWNQSRWGGSARAVIINSGNANACTGSRGATDTLKMAKITAEKIGCSMDDVFVMSTGIIGELMPMEQIVTGIDNLSNKWNSSAEGVQAAADGMLTTDTFPKVSSRSFKAGNEEYAILGLAKGAGMIGPKMATMLAVLTTDFPLPFNVENQQRFQKVMDHSFNRISVDGHTSTSDQAILLAANPAIEPGENGASQNSGNSQINDDVIEIFFRELESVAIELAKMIPADGEGARHLITIEVTGPNSSDELTTIARTIADSPLVKTAVFGCDPNWGRIVSAAGYAGVKFDPLKTTLHLNDTLLYQNGNPVPFDEESVSLSMKDSDEAFIKLEVGEPLHSAIFWTSDLTYDYVKINAEYHT